MEYRSHREAFGLFAAAFGLLAVFLLVEILPLIVAYWIAAQVYPDSDLGAGTDQAMALLKKRSGLANKIMAAFFILLVACAWPS
jgi:hypothetical protein